MILRCRANHRRTTDVDVLNGFGNRRVLSSDGLLERIQVDDQQIDGFDTVFIHNRLIGTAASQ